MFSRLVLITLAFSAVKISAQDFGGDFGVLSDSSSYFFNGSNGCNLGFCDTSASQAIDASGLASGTSPSFIDGFNTSQIHLLGPSFAPQMQAIQSEFTQALDQVVGAPASALGSTIDYLQQTVQGFLNDPSGSAVKIGAAAAGVIMAAFPPADFIAGELLGSGLSLSADMATGSSVYSALGDLAAGVSVDVSAIGGSNAGPIIYNTLGLADALNEVQGGGTTQTQTFPVPIIDLSTTGTGASLPAGSFGGYSGLSGSSSVILNPQNTEFDSNSLQELLQWAQMMQSLGPRTLSPIPLAQTTTPSGLCASGYAPNPSAFAHMFAGLPPGANEFLCVPTSVGQKTSLGPKPVTIGASNSPQGTGNSSTLQTATSTPSQNSSGSGLCPNPAANVSNPHGVTSAPGAGVPPGAVTSPNTPSSSYIPLLIPCSQIATTASASPASAAHVSRSQTGLPGQHHTSATPVVGAVTANKPASEGKVILSPALAPSSRAGSRRAPVDSASLGRSGSVLNTPRSAQANTPLVQAPRSLALQRDMPHGATGRSNLQPVPVQSYVPQVQSHKPYVPPAPVQSPVPQVPSHRSYVPPVPVQNYVPQVPNYRPYVPPVPIQTYVPPLPVQSYIPQVPNYRPYVPPVLIQTYVPPVPVQTYVPQVPSYMTPTYVAPVASPIYQPVMPAYEHVGVSAPVPIYTPTVAPSYSAPTVSAAPAPTYHPAPPPAYRPPPPRPR